MSTNTNKNQMILIIFLPLLVFSNPTNQRPIFVKRHESSQMGGHTECTIDEVQASVPKNTVYRRDGHPVLRLNPNQISGKSGRFFRFNRRTPGQFRLKSSVFSGSGFPGFNREFSGGSGFYQFNREFSRRFRLKSSCFFRFLFFPVEPGIMRVVPGGCSGFLRLSGSG